MPNSTSMLGTTDGGPWQLVPIFWWPYFGEGKRSPTMKCSKLSQIHLVFYFILFFPLIKCPATHHHPHRVFGTVNTSDTSPDARAVQSSLGRVIMVLPQPFRFLGIALYGFLQCQLPLTFSHLFWQIRPPGLGSPDCSSHLGSGIIITVSNELQPKLSL